MTYLNGEQAKRLREILNEGLSGSTIRDISTLVDCSTGSISQISSGKGPVTKCTALSICIGLDVNPFYVLEGKEPKYQPWEEAFG